MKKIKIVTIILILIVLSGCSKKGFMYIDGKVNIVATTTILGDLAKEVGGEEVVVTTLMNPGVDPHQYQTKVSDTKGLLKADLILVNGLHLEGRMAHILEKLDDKRVLSIGDFIDKSKLIYLEENEVDPHIWFDLNIWKECVQILRDRLILIDNANEKKYIENANKYLFELNELQEYINNKVVQLPIEKRILVTAHDAFNYFGKQYSFRVYSIQGLSTESEASIKDIKELAMLLKELDVKAIFVESSVSEATIRSVIDAARAVGHDVVVGGELYSDSLGDEASGDETYIKTFKKNINNIIDALS